jgi:hypothetical protein
MSLGALGVVPAGASTAAGWLRSGRARWRGSGAAAAQDDDLGLSLAAAVAEPTLEDAPQAANLRRPSVPSVEADGP